MIRTYELGSTGMQWTSIGLGTWMMEKNPQTSITALKAGIEEGANHIDTAEMYGDGRVEEIVREAIRGIRANVFLVSKVLPSNADYEGTLAACHRSLKRLNVDYLDLYLLHWRERRTPLAEAFRAFAKLQEQGKIRHWGVSNFNVDDMEEALRLVGPGKIACNQVLYHLGERAIEEKLIPWCRSHKVAVVAYSPFGQGRLPQHPLLDQLSQAHDATPSQIILSYLTRDPSMFAIPKASQEKHVRENVRAMGIQLTPEDIRKIDAAFPLKTRRSLPMI